MTSSTKKKQTQKPSITLPKQKQKKRRRKRKKPSTVPATKTRSQPHPPKLTQQRQAAQPRLSTRNTAITNNLERPQTIKQAATPPTTQASPPPAPTPPCQSTANTPITQNQHPPATQRPAARQSSTPPATTPQRQSIANTTITQHQHTPAPHPRRYLVYPAPAHQAHQLTTQHQQQRQPQVRLQNPITANIMRLKHIIEKRKNKDKSQILIIAQVQAL